MKRYVLDLKCRKIELFLKYIYINLMLGFIIELDFILIIASQE